MALLKTLTVNGVTYAVTPPTTTCDVILKASAWSGSDGLYYQLVEVAGVTPRAKVDLQPSPEQLDVFHEKDLAFTTTNEDGAVTVYAIGDRPQNDYTIQVTVTELEHSDSRIIKGNTVGTPVPRTNWHQTDSTKADYLKGRDALASLISEAQSRAVDASVSILRHSNDAANPHGVTIAQIGAAPAGYGVGDVTQEANDLDTVTQCGWYAFTSGAKNTPFEYGAVMVMNRYGSQVVQMAFNPYMSHFGAICVRYKNNDGWRPWEYINPPMELGVEYRTTERHKGKPVYVTRLNVGALGSSTTVTATLPSAPTEIVELCGMVKSDEYSEALAFPVITTSGSVGASIRKTGTATIGVTTYADYSGYTATATVKYTKD